MSTDLLQPLVSNVWSIFLVVLFFGGSIFVHELGHFLAARWRGVHVERFSIGFGRAIFSWHGRDGVEYRIAWIPLGGYVLLPQLADLGALEGQSETDVASLPSIGYLDKLVVFVAGAFFNILFALALATVVWIIGQPESAETATTQIGYVSPTVQLPTGQSVQSPAAEAGLRIGDIVRTIDGRAVTNWIDITYQIGLGSGVAKDGRREAIFRIERHGQPLEIAVHPLLVGDEKERKVGIAPGYPLSVQEVTAGSPGEKAGFKSGDELLTIDGVPALNSATYYERIEAGNKTPVAVRVKRAEKEITLTVPPHAASKQGFGLGLSLGLQYTHPTPFAQLSEHINMTFRTIGSLLNPHSDVGLSKVSGPVGIVRIFHSAAEAGIRVSLMFAILVNVNLAIFNLLPIPILDGGQILFATIGKLRGRALPPNVVIATQSAFSVLLITMVLYISIFDVRRWVRDVKADHAEAATAPAEPAAGSK